MDLGPVIRIIAQPMSKASFSSVFLKLGLEVRAIRFGVLGDHAYLRVLSLLGLTCLGADA